MQTAFAFPAEMAEFPGIGNFIEPFGGNAVPDRNITLFPKRVKGEGVSRQVAPDFLVGPFEDGEEFPAGILTAKNFLFLPVV